jgi:hypothetical protein
MEASRLDHGLSFCAGMTRSDVLQRPASGGAPGIERLDAVGGVDDLADLDGDARNGVNSSQERRHIAIMAG